MSIKVRATRIGFYGSLRYPGDEFEVDEAEFVKPWTWVEVIDEDAADEPAKPKPKARVHPAQGRQAPRPSEVVPGAEPTVALSQVAKPAPITPAPEGPI